MEERCLTITITIDCNLSRESFSHVFPCFNPVRNNRISVSSQKIKIKTLSVCKQMLIPSFFGVIETLQSWDDLRRNNKCLWQNCISISQLLVNGIKSKIIKTRSGATLNQFPFIFPINFRFNTSSYRIIEFVPYLRILSLTWRRRVCREVLSICAHQCMQEDVSNTIV